MTDKLENQVREMFTELTAQKEEYLRKFLAGEGLTEDEFIENYLFEESEPFIGDDGSLRQDFRIRPLKYEEKEGRRD